MTLGERRRARTKAVVEDIAAVKIRDVLNHMAVKFDGMGMAEAAAVCREEAVIADSLIGLEAWRA
jgi:hypothetical protein